MVVIVIKELLLRFKIHMSYPIRLICTVTRCKKQINCWKPIDFILLAWTYEFLSKITWLWEIFTCNPTLLAKPVLKIILVIGQEIYVKLCFQLCKIKICAVAISLFRKNLDVVYAYFVYP